MAATTLNTVEQATATDLLTTQFTNSMADNTMTAAGSAVQNIQGGGTANFGGYPLCDLQLTLAAPAGALTAGASILFWFLKSIDGGTTYEDGSSTVTPPRQPDVIFPLNAVATAQKVTIQNVQLPAGYFKPIAKTSGMGQTLNASGGNKITALPVSFQGQ